MSTTKPASPEPNARPPKGTIYGAVGAIVEWYDMMLYAYMAVVFAHIFFPETMDPGIRLAVTLAGFAIGYLMRPLGGIFFGWVGDRYGRKPSLTIAISLMTVPMLGTALLPTYADWGYAALVGLLLFRMLQGFSVGGEYSGTLVFLSEAGERKGRAYMASVATLFSGLGVLLAALVATLVTGLMSQVEVNEWGWRIPYFFGASVALVGILMRLRMEETETFIKLKQEGRLAAHPMRRAIRLHWRSILVVAALSGYSGIAYYIVATYLVAYLSRTVGVSHNTALVVATFIALVYTGTAIAFGRFSDRFGRKPPMLWSAAALALLSWPAFELLNTGSLGLIFLGELLLLVPLMFFTGAFTAAVTEYLPTISRDAGMGIGYNVGMAAFGATAPTVAQTLIYLTGIELMPAFYLIAASVLIIPIIVRQRETAFENLEQVDIEAEEREPARANPAGQ